jgi:hypothetical protein
MSKKAVASCREHDIAVPGAIRLRRHVALCNRDDEEQARRLIVLLFDVAVG